MDLFDIPLPPGLKPNLAGKFDPIKQKFPCYGSYKLDGIRALGIQGHGLVSRTLKKIPNRHIQQIFSDLHGFDGELIVGEPFAGDAMQKTSSGVMAYGGKPEVTFYAFDRWDTPGIPYSRRLQSLRYLALGKANVVVLEQFLIESQEELDELETRAVSMGYEGIMVRSIDGLYKNGRSTTNEGGLLKLKRFEGEIGDDSDAVVIGFKELMHNNNEIDEATFIRLGVSRRSSHAENKVGGDTLGALLCQTTEGGVEFSIGTGFTQDQRREIWVNQDKYLNRTVKFKHFTASGVKNKPRFPVFIAFRAEVDV